MAGGVLTGGGDKTARLWETATGKAIRVFQGHASWVKAVAFSPEGRWVLTGGSDGTTRLWDAVTASELCRLVSFRDGTWAVVDPDSRFDASNGGDVQSLHWVIGNEPISLDQLKDRYYDPLLLAKYRGLNKEPLRQVGVQRRGQPGH
jgi:WD40 repeat protein